MKKSQIVFSIFFIFCAYFILAHSAVFYGQTKRDSEIRERRIFDEKPQTIRLKPDKIIISANASDNEKQLFISEREGLLYSFDLESTEQLWVADLGGKTASNLIETEKLLYVVTSRENDSDNETANITDIKIVSSDKKDSSEISIGSSVLWAIDKKTGITAHRIDVFGDFNFYLYKSGEVIYLTDNSRVSVFDEELKEAAEDFVFDKKLNGEPFFDREKEDLYLIFEDEILKIVIKEDKLVYEKIIKADKHNQIHSFAVSEDNYFAGDETGNLSAYKKSDKTRIWTFRAGGKISDIEIFDDKLIVSSFDNFLYCLKNENGKRIWKKRFPGRISKVNKSSDSDFFVRSNYSTDYYLVDSSSGDISGKYSTKSGDVKDDNSETGLQTTMRLIIILKSHSIDIYKKY